MLDLNAGPVPVVFPADRNRAGDRSAGDNSGAAFGEMTQPDPVFGATHDAATVAPLLGLREEDCATEAAATDGLHRAALLHRRAPDRSEALGRLRVDLARSEEYFRGSDAKFFYAIAPEEPGVWRARMQFYNGEDPATGSAAGCAIAYMVQHGIAAPREQLHLRQGVEIGRPSDLYVECKFRFGKNRGSAGGGQHSSCCKWAVFP